MTLLFDIIKFCAGSLFFGIIGALVVVGLIIYLIRGLSSSAQVSVVGWLTGGLLFVLLGYQFTCVGAAMAMKDKCEEVKAIVDQSLASTQAVMDATSVSEQDVNNLMGNISEEYPLIGRFVAGRKFDISHFSQVSDDLAQSINSSLTSSIWKSLGWSLLFIVIATFVIVKTREQYRASSRRSRPAVRASSGRRGRPVGVRR